MTSCVRSRERILPSHAAKVSHRLKAYLGSLPQQQGAGMHAGLQRCLVIHTEQPLYCCSGVRQNLCMRKIWLSPQPFWEFEFHNTCELAFKTTTMYLIKTRFKRGPSTTSHPSWSERSVMHRRTSLGFFQMWAGTILEGQLGSAERKILTKGSGLAIAKPV